MTPLTPTVTAAVEATFREGEQGDALQRRPTGAELCGPSPVERIQLAVVALSRGDLGRLSHFAEQARRDWRDVLYWAEGPRDEDEPHSWDELRERLGLARDGHIP